MNDVVVENDLEMENYIKRIYQDHVLSEVLTDAYHYTTTAAYFNEGRAQNDSVFYMFGRKEAFGGGYTVSSGLMAVIAVMGFWKEHGIPKDIIEYLRKDTDPTGARRYSDEYLDFLGNLNFEGVQIDGLQEGSVFFPQEPVLRVRGPLTQVKMIESVALGIMNGHSAYATIAARLVEAGEKDFGNGSPKMKISAQGLRRGPGIGPALESILPLVTGGCSSTSTGTAAKLLDIPFVGTMDHQWVMAHKNEYAAKGLTLKEMLMLEQKINSLPAGPEKRREKRVLQKALSEDAFRSYAFTHRNWGTFLLDTYDPVNGLENAIKVIKEMKELGWGSRYAVRFDSGDLTAYSKLALRRFAEEGFIEGLPAEEVKGMSDAELLLRCEKCTVGCSAADGLDEYTIQDMRKNGAWYTTGGVGTATTHPGPLGLVYKMASMFMDITDNQIMVQGDEQLTPTMKVIATSPEKSSNPGFINSRRVYDEEGKLTSVVIYDEVLGFDENGQAVNLRDFDDVQQVNWGVSTKDSMTQIYDEKGKLVYKFPTKVHPEGHIVVDANALNKHVRAEIDTLPEGVRRVVRPRDALIEKALGAHFKAAKKTSAASFTVSTEELIKNLPPEAERIPVFLDMKLYRQRQHVQEDHLAKGRSLQSHGVAAYEERFATGTPDPTAGGQVQGQVQQQQV